MITMPPSSRKFFFASVTVPPAGATIGVESGPAISRPKCGYPGEELEEIRKKELSAPSSAPVAQSDPGTRGQSSPLRQEVDDLRSRVESLETRLASLEEGLGG